MKRFIAAVSFAVLAVPAFSGGLPYDQSLIDRALPKVEPRRMILGAAAAFRSSGWSDL